MFWRMGIVGPICLSIFVGVTSCTASVNCRYEPGWVDRIEDQWVVLVDSDGGSTDVPLRCFADVPGEGAFVGLGEWSRVFGMVGRLAGEWLVDELERKGGACYKVESRMPNGEAGK